MKNQLLFLFFAITLFKSIYSQDKWREIQFPDIPGYQTLVADLHQHTVFSDGYVWPDVRIWEAEKDGIDAISLTDHIEYQPWQKDIPNPDRNRVYELAKKSAKDKGIIVINGAEITRDMPPGHSNAIFLQDVNKLLIEDSVAAYEEAKKQGAFIFWNHPHWTSQKKDGIATLTDLHKEFIEKGYLHGIEVVNDVSYSDEALQIALDHNLTILGTSDIHGLIDWRHDIPGGGHRPVTLIFAKSKDEAAIKTALFDRATVVWYLNNLIGRDEYLIPLIISSLKISKATYQENYIMLEITLNNTSDCNFLLQNNSDFTFHKNSDIIQIDAHSKKKIFVKTGKIMDEINLEFHVLNGINAPNSHPKVTFTSTIQ